MNLKLLLKRGALIAAANWPTIAVQLAAEAAAGPIEREPLTYDTTIRQAYRFTLQRFMDGCRRLFRRYLVLGGALMLVYVVSGGAYLAAVVYGYQAIGDRFLIGWTFVAA